MLEYTPIILNPRDPIDNKQLESIRTQAGVGIIDSIHQQLLELISIQNVGKTLDKSEKETLLKGILNDQSIDNYGNWIFYPWSKLLVHLLPEPEFITVRTNRNKVKITKDEQEILATKKVGIIGLSVGQSIAVTMAIERTCGELRLADFDTLDLSNLNRLRAGVHLIGLPKVIVAAREIAEIDPYLKVVIFGDGVTETNLDNFLGQNETKLDILVEVCDGLDIKIQSRKAARSKGIPVIMDTNDKGMIDIERFDLEPVRKLFHGLIEEDSNIYTLTPQERMQVLMKLVSFENISDRLKQSVGEIGKTISTWPQLASSVMLGGAITTDICRRILLKQHSTSGRFYVDLETLI